jgi:hypothetical protein
MDAVSSVNGIKGSYQQLYPVETVATRAISGQHLQL